MNENPDNQLILYQTEDGSTEIQVTMQDETIWLTQKQMVELFQRDQSVISRHLNNVFKEGELERKSNMQKLHIANSDKPVAFYNLDVVISVGYRVKSHRGTQFRIWATKTLREYLVKGFVMNDERLKGTEQNYFDELVERVRRIRTSEKQFYRKVLDIFLIVALSLKIKGKYRVSTWKPKYEKNYKNTEKENRDRVWRHSPSLHSIF